jgi:hypothetical protein
MKLEWGRVGMISALLLLFICAERSLGRAYEEAPVLSGGTLSGRVFLKGTPPPARIFHLIFSPNIDFCGKVSDGKGNRLLKEFRVSPDGGFRDVVVALVGVPRGKPFDYTPKLTLDTCRIAPFVAPIRNDHSIEIVNDDPITHDIQAYTLRENYTFAMFNKPMIPKSRAIKQVRLRKDHYLFRTQCGVHDFMQSWGMAVGNPYFAVSGADGRFTIADIPPGTYEVIAWHPHMELQVREVSIPPGGRAQIAFEFDASQVKISLHDLEKQYRLRPALDPIPMPVPSVEHQDP